MYCLVPFDLLMNGTQTPKINGTTDHYSCTAQKNSVKSNRVNKYCSPSLAHFCKFGVHRKNIISNNDSDKLTFYNSNYDYVFFS